MLVSGFEMLLLACVSIFVVIRCRWVRRSERDRGSCVAR